MKRNTKLAILLLTVLCAMALCGGAWAEYTELESDYDEYVAVLTADEVQAEILHQKLLACETLGEMHEMMLLEENESSLFCLNETQLRSLYQHVQDLYNALPEPTEAEQQYYELLVIDLTTLAEGYGISLTANSGWNTSGGTISTNTTITLDTDTTLSGQYVVTGNNVTLTIELADGLTKNVTIRAEANTAKKNMFQVAQGAKLVIKGNSENAHIVIDGSDANSTRRAIELQGADTDLELQYVTIQNMKLSSGGGVAVYVQASTPTASDKSIPWNNNKVSLSNVTVKDCESGTDSILHFYGNASMEGCTVSNCKSGGTYGGVIKGSGGTNYCNLIMKNCNVAGNTSPGWGGAILWACNGNGAKLDIDGCTFTNNKAEYLGGAISVEGDVEIKNTTISGNTAKAGGGIAVFPFTLDTGASMSNACGLKLGSGNTITNNTATATESFTYPESGNSAHTYPVGGGGIWVYMFTPENATEAWSSELTIGSSNDISGNTSMTIGGGVAMIKEKDDLGTVSLNVKGGTISGNAAPNGGGVAVDGGTFTMTDGNITGNGSTNSVTTANGGGVYVAGGEFTISGGTISGNAASANGGGAYVTGGNFTVSGGTIGGTVSTDANTAKNGGGAYVTGGTFTISAGTISGNTASGNGGGAYVDNAGSTSTASNFTMSGGTISGNAATNGGGAYVNGGSFNMSGTSVISGNTASKNGGGAYVNGGNFDMTNGTIGGSENARNSALNGGGAYINGGNFTMSSGTMSYNVAQEKTSGQAEAGNEGYGGGIYANGGNITIGIRDCTKSSPCELHKAGEETFHPVVENNTAVFGGGLAASGGTITVYCCNMSNNVSDNRGTGENVFISEGVFNHYWDGAEIGEEKDHGMVSIGGTLNVIQANEDTVVIRITYHENLNNFIENYGEITWEGTAPKDYVLNLPYCPKTWQDVAANKELAFAGWSDEAITKEDTQKVRCKGDYNSIGTPIKLESKEGTYDFYGVWVPRWNKIYYAYSTDGKNIVLDDEEKAEAYEYRNTNSSIIVNSPTKAGYKFTGWMMYSTIGKISNWNADAINVNAAVDVSITDDDKQRWEKVKAAYTDYTESENAEERNKSGITVKQIEYVADSNLWKNKDEKLWTSNTIQIQQNFGDIVLVAMFEPEFSQLKIVKNVTGTVDADQSFIFHIAGQPDDEARSEIDMDVVIRLDADKSSGSITLAGLPVGTYTVTERTDWSWRYKLSSCVETSEAAVAALAETADEVSNGKAVTISDPSKLTVLTFTNSRTETNWLDGSSYAKNAFSAVVNGEVVPETSSTAGTEPTVSPSANTN